MKELLFIWLSCIAILVNSQTSTGIASYYADKFEGRKTSSGEIFRQRGLTAAHKTLPFGTLVRVTNLSNDSVVIVKINDRLPGSSKRMIDLTERAAEQLNFIRKGLTKVTIEKIHHDSIASDYTLWRREEIKLSCRLDSTLIFSEREKLLQLDTAKIDKNLMYYFRDLAMNYYAGHCVFQNTDTTYSKQQLRFAIENYSKFHKSGLSTPADLWNYVFCLYHASECETAAIISTEYLALASEEEKTKIENLKSRFCP